MCILDRTWTAGEKRFRNTSTWINKRC